MKWVWSGSVHQGWALWGRKVSRNTWNTELRFWLSLAHAPAIQVGAPTSLHPPFPAFFFLQVPQPPLTLLPSPRLSVSNITSDLLSIQYVFFSVCLPPSLKIWLSQTPFQSLHYPSIFFFFCLGHLTRYITASILSCPPPAVHTLFPAAKISYSPLPHPQRAYKFRAPSLLMCSFSVVQ